MKMLYIFLMFGFYSNAQLSYFAEYNGSVRASIDYKDFTHLVISNSFSFGIKKRKMLFSFGVGREDWNLDYFNRPPSNSEKRNIYNYHSETYKVSTTLERQFNIPITKFSIRAGLGAKIYFCNKLKKSFIHNNVYNAISIIKPSTISKLIPYEYYSTFEGLTFGSLDDYDYLTNIPYALTGNFAIQYSFQKWAFKIYYEPYFMRVKYKNAKWQDKTGKTFIFYNDIGVGVNYPLNFKKKQAKEK